MFSRATEAFLDSLLFAQAWKVSSENSTSHGGMSPSDWFYLIFVIGFLLLSIIFALTAIIPPLNRWLSKPLDGYPSMILHGLTLITFSTAWVQGLSDLSNIVSAPKLLIWIVTYLGMFLFIALSIIYIFLPVPPGQISRWRQLIQNKAAKPSIEWGKAIGTQIREKLRILPRGKQGD